MVKDTANRVVITGFGCLTSVGSDFMSSWDAIKAGHSGITMIQQWDVTGWEHPLGAEIKNYEPRTMISDRKLLKLLSRHDVIGLNAVAQAVAHSGIMPYRDTLADVTQFNDRFGVYVGSPGMRYTQQYDFHPLLTYAAGDMKKFGEGLFEQVHPMWLLRILPNNVLAYTGIQYNFKGANENVTNHAVSGMQALTEAYYALRDGIVDRAVAVSYESGVEPEAQINYGTLGALSPTGLRPYDQERNGTVLAEGAGCLVLETLSAAEERNATIYGEILGAATTSEAMGVFPIRDDGDGLARAIQGALKKARMGANDIGVITAHGNGTQNSDATEAMAISRVFGANTVPVMGYKWSLGHTLTAAGVIETLFSLQSLREKQIPGIATLNKVAYDCMDLNVSQQPQAIKLPIALGITRGFASVNSCLIISSDVS